MAQNRFQVAQNGFQMSLQRAVYTFVAKSNADITEHSNGYVQLIAVVQI
jgi:hypothetical protein